MVNGSLAQMGSGLRLRELCPMAGNHFCEGVLGDEVEGMTKVRLLPRAS
jgi:hypothetical protein